MSALAKLFTLLVASFVMVSFLQITNNCFFQLGNVASHLKKKKSMHWLFFFYSNLLLFLSQVPMSYKVIYLLSICDFGELCPFPVFSQE